MKLSELADRTGARVEGDAAEIEIEGAAALDESAQAQVPFLANPRYTPRVQTTRASAVYVAEGVETGRQDLAVLRARDPYLAYTRALRVFHPEPSFEPFVHPSAVIDPTARVHERVWIGACVVVGRGAEIAEGVRLHANVTVYEGVSVGPD